jgi:uncharacterized protein YceK
MYAASASSEKVLYTFPSAETPPATGLVVGPRAALYGATTDSVYQLTQNTKKDWVVTPIYTFTGSAAEDFADQINSLVYYGGSLYGTSRGGGTACPQNTSGCGFVFELTPSTTTPTKWTEKTIYKFSGKTDGVQPSGITVSDTGVIYGTTSAGGGASACGSNNGFPEGCGTVFKLELVKGKWTQTALHRFEGGTDLIQPGAAPSLDAVGNIYISAPQGGGSGTNAIRAQKSPRADSCDGYGGFGIILHGAKPEYLKLFIDTCKSLGPEYADAVLFGLINGEPDNNTVKNTLSPEVVSGTVKEAANEVIVTSLGGGLVTKCAEAENNGCGEVALLTKPKSGTGMWALKVLHDFSGPDGAGPYGELLNVGQKLYGVTEGDGNSFACATSPALGGCGTIFALTKGSAGWSWGGTIYKFKSGTDGAAPLGQLTLYKGQIFGVTAEGGKNTHCTTCGTIFLLTP